MIAQQNILDLVAMIKQGSQIAESKFVKKYERIIFAIAFHYVSNKEDAEEITYDTLTICISNIKNDKLREPEKIGSYIYGVCWRLCKKHQKKKIEIIKGVKIIHESLNDESRKRNLEKTISEMYGQEDPLMNLEKSERRKEIRDAVTKVKNKNYREVLGLIFTGRSYKEIAKKLEINLGKLYTRSLRARKALHKILDEIRNQET